MIASFRYKTNALGAFILASGLSDDDAFPGDLGRKSCHPAIVEKRVDLFSFTVAFLGLRSLFSHIRFRPSLPDPGKGTENKKVSAFYISGSLPFKYVMTCFSARSLSAFILMSITILTGALWAQQAWGRFWSWDPKETASLISWGIYLFLINYRLSASWRGRRAAYISIIGFVSILLTFGINWGLHTYL